MSSSQTASAGKKPRLASTKSFFQLFMRFEVVALCQSLKIALSPNRHGKVFNCGTGRWQ